MAIKAAGTPLKWSEIQTEFGPTPTSMSNMKQYRDIDPVGGITDPEKMAQQVLYLCSPAADVITGDMLIADGGQWLVGNAFYQMGKQFLDE